MCGSKQDQFGLCCQHSPVYHLVCTEYHLVANHLVVVLHTPISCQQCGSQYCLDTLGLSIAKLLIEKVYSLHLDVQKSTYLQIYLGCIPAFAPTCSTGLSHNSPSPAFQCVWFCVVILRTAHFPIFQVYICTYFGCVCHLESFVNLGKMCLCAMGSTLRL